MYNIIIKVRKYLELNSKYVCAKVILILYHADKKNPSRNSVKFLAL